MRPTNYVEYRWDETNGRLVAHWFRVYGSSIRIRTFHSPLFMKDAMEARLLHKMTRVGDDAWIGSDFVEMLNKALELRRNLREEAEWKARRAEGRFFFTDWLTKRMPDIYA